MENEQGDFRLRAGEGVIQLEKKRIELFNDADNAFVIYSVRQMAALAGFRATDEAMIATAASELTTNILRYAKKGEIQITLIRRLEDHDSGIELFATDKGQGIANLELALQDQYSSSPKSLGLGLPSVKRIMDDFFIESILGKGTRVLVRKWKKE